jgi:hypothetical protein
MTTNNERNTMINDHHFTGPYAPSIPDEDLWVDLSDTNEDEGAWSDADDEDDPWPQGDIFAEA